MAFELNKLYLDDCLTLLDEIPKESVHLVLTSPPYNLDIKYDTYKDTKPFDEYIEWMDKVFTKCIDVLSPGGHILIQIANTGRNPYLPITDFISVRLSRKIMMAGEIVWEKQNAHAFSAWGSWKSANKPGLRDSHEYILVFRKEGDRKGKSDITRDEFLEYTRGIWHVTPETRSKWKHPAPFPENLVRRAVKLYSFVGETVLDPFVGSGTVPVVCNQLKRNWIGCDISEEYLKMAQMRIEQEGTLLCLANDGVTNE